MIFILPKCFKNIDFLSISSIVPASEIFLILFLNLFLFMADHDNFGSGTESQSSVGGEKNKWYKQPFVWFVVLAIAAFVGYNAYFSVPPKHVAVLDRQGVTRGVHKSGPHLKVPILDKVWVYDVGIHRFNYSSGGDTLKTKTMVKVKKISLTILYNLNGDMADTLCNKVGTEEEFRNNVLQPVVAGTVQKVIGTYEPEYIVSNQNTVQEGLSKIIGKELADTKLVSIGSLQLSSLQFEDSFEKAALDVELAKKLSAKITITSKAIADSMKIVTGAITNPIYIDYLIAKAQGNWRGDVPQNLIVGGNSEVLPIMPLGRGKK